MILQAMLSDANHMLDEEIKSELSSQSKELEILGDEPQKANMDKDSNPVNQKAALLAFLGLFSVAAYGYYKNYTKISEISEISEINKLQLEQLKFDQQKDQGQIKTLLENNYNNAQALTKAHYAIRDKQIQQQRLEEKITNLTLLNKDATSLLREKENLKNQIETDGKTIDELLEKQNTNDEGIKIFIDNQKLDPKKVAELKLIKSTLQDLYIHPIENQTLVSLTVGLARDTINQTKKKKARQKAVLEIEHIKILWNDDLLLRFMLEKMPFASAEILGQLLVMTFELEFSLGVHLVSMQELRALNYYVNYAHRSTVKDKSAGIFEPSKYFANKNSFFSELSSHIHQMMRIITNPEKTLSNLAEDISNPNIMKEPGLLNIIADHIKPLEFHLDSIVKLCHGNTSFVELILAVLFVNAPTDKSQEILMKLLLKYRDTKLSSQELVAIKHKIKMHEEEDAWHKSTALLVKMSDTSDLSEAEKNIAKITENIKSTIETAERNINVCYKAEKILKLIDIITELPDSTFTHTTIDKIQFFNAVFSLISDKLKKLESIEENGISDIATSNLAILENLVKTVEKHLLSDSERSESITLDQMQSNLKSALKKLVEEGRSQGKKPKTPEEKNKSQENKESSKNIKQLKKVINLIMSTDKESRKPQEALPFLAIDLNILKLSEITPNVIKSVTKTIDLKFKEAKKIQEFIYLMIKNSTVTIDLRKVLDVDHYVSLLVKSLVLFFKQTVTIGDKFLMKILSKEVTIIIKTNQKEIKQKILLSVWLAFLTNPGIEQISAESSDKTTNDTINNLVKSIQQAHTSTIKENKLLDDELKKLSNRTNSTWKEFAEANKAVIENTNS